MKYAKRLEQEDNFIKLYKFTCQLKPTESYMLSYLIDAEQFVENRIIIDNEEYFECCKKGFIDNLLINWGEKTIDKAIKNLEKLDLIKVKVRNINRRKGTWIKLNYDNIDKLNILWKDRK